FPVLGAGGRPGSGGLGRGPDACAHHGSRRAGWAVAGAAPQQEGSTNMIELKDLTVRFGGVVALDAVSVVFEAPVSGIIGPNGAGKTTSMNVISGLLPSSGEIVFNAETLSRHTPHHRARWGLRRSF